MVEKIYRTKSIKIRMTPDEHEQLLLNKDGGELATWLRNLGLSKGKTSAQTVKIADPHLVREFSRIGVNLNQIAKAANRYELIDQIQIINHLKSIDDQLKELLKRHDC